MILNLFFAFTFLIYTVKTQDSVKFCPNGYHVCKNNGLCLVIDEQSLICICTNDYTGI